MKKIIIYVIIGALLLLIGIVIGLLYRPKLFRDTQMLPDTVYVKEKISYGRLELQANTYKLNIPKFDIPKYYFIEYESTKIEYRDSIRYIVLPSESYHTKINNIEIFHHGIKSEIDSVNVDYYNKIMYVSQTERTKEKKNYIAVGVEAGWCNTASIPIYLEYSRLLHKNIEFNARVFHDLAIRQTGFRAGVNANIGW